MWTWSARGGRGGSAPLVGAVGAALRARSRDLLTVDEFAPLPGPGIIARDGLLDSDVDLAHDFGTAVNLAQEAIVADPELGLRAAVEAVPTIAEDEATALAVLEATIEVWLGGLPTISSFVDQTIWCPGYESMHALGFIDGSVPIEDMVDIFPMGTLHGTFGCEET